MKKLRDYILLPAIILLALGLGFHLLKSLGETNLKVDQFDIIDLTDFEKKAKINQPSNEDQYIYARQWSWGDEITLRSGRKYIVHLATGDIAHSFHLPAKAMGDPVDVLLLPGQIYRIILQDLKPGIYPIGCTEYCGIEHNKMRTRLVVLE
ncbi:MAG: hypothetical protein HWE30_06305 [Methylocystaceae bacterium]|nr:hypothetical protein [Methylocystaceae bacterium]